MLSGKNSSCSKDDINRIYCVINFKYQYWSCNIRSVCSSGLLLLFFNRNLFLLIHHLRYACVCVLSFVNDII